MPLKKASAEWSGSLTAGKGSLKTQSGAVNVPYDWRSRSGDGAGTNPEELIAAAHAGCFSMALSHILSEGGHAPTRIATSAEVSFDQVPGGFAITKITLRTEGTVPGIDEAAFLDAANKAKAGCPVSKALASVPITLEAKFVK